MSHGLNIHDGTGIIARDPAAGILLAYGDTVPADNTIGYAPGCLFQQTDGASEATYLYVNVGTKALSNFDAIDLNVAEMALLSGLLATSAELNRAADLSSRVVDVTASTLALTLADHDGKDVTINAAAGCAVTLPAATGTGARFRVSLMTTVTSNTTTFTRAGSDAFWGVVYQLADGGSTLAAYELPGSTVITLDGSTKGGIKGDILEFTDVGTNQWKVVAHLTATGTEATPVT